MKEFIMRAQKLLSILSVCALHSIYAQSHNPFTGFFVGLNVGADLLTGSNQYKSTRGSGESSLRKFGAAYGACMGYMRLMPSKVLWGSEVYYTMHSAKATQKMMTTIEEGNLNVQHKNSMGVSALMGMAANPRLVAFGKFSLESSTFDIAYTGLTGGVEDQSQKKRSLSIIPGTGVMYKLSDSIVLGVEYAYALMKEIKTEVGEMQCSYKPAQNRLMGSLRYLF